MKLTRKEVFNIPNCLSFIRLLLIPLFVYYYTNAASPADYYYAALLILVSALTDLVDGYVARNFGQITELGKTLDPIADKLTQAAVIICLMTRYKWMWALVLLFVVKELFMGINGLILLKKGRKLDGAKWFGKLSTAVFFICMVLLIGFPEMPNKASAALMMTTALFLMLSFILYFPLFIKMYMEYREDHHAAKI